MTDKATNSSIRRQGRKLGYAGAGLAAFIAAMVAVAASASAAEATPIFSPEASNIMFSGFFAGMFEDAMPQATMALEAA